MSMSPCAHAIPWEVLVDYWAGQLPAGEVEGVEEHLFGCAACTAQSARVASVTEALRILLPPAVSRARVDGLRTSGRRIRESVFLPDDRREVVFGADADLMIHRLSGLDLGSADRVGLQIVAESTGERFVTLDSVPFERDEGAVLIACQRHFASLPHDTRFEVSVHAPGRPVATTSYTILHQYR
jgi:hypothetical protein